MANDTRRRDWPGMIGAVGFILLGLWVIQQTLTMTTFGSIFPRAIAAVMIVCSLALLATSLRSAARPQNSDEVAAVRARESTPRRLALVGVMLAWVVLMPIVGFVVSSTLSFFAILAIANYDGWPVKRTIVYVVTTAVVVVAFYMLMVDVLLIPVPKGFLI